MRSGSFLRTGYLLVALFPAAGRAADTPATVCPEWQAKFYQVDASWLGSASLRSEVERLFGVPTGADTQGACTRLQYAANGCACWFTVCSQGRVVSKTLTVGAAAAPAFASGDPADLTEAMRALQEGLRGLQAETARLERTLAGLGAPPAPSPAAAPPPAAAAAKPPPRAAPRPQCAATTRQGAQCTRRAAEGSLYCWQHQR